MNFLTRIITVVPCRQGGIARTISLIPILQYFLSGGDLRVFRNLVLLLGLAACSLPRGAAIESEIIGKANEAHPGFAVVSVTRNNLQTIASWPASGTFRVYNWIRNTASGGFTIAPNDRVTLTIWDNEENSLLTAPGQKAVEMKEMTVSQSGKVFIPYLDEIKISGLTKTQARAKLQKGLEQIVPSAQVQISVVPGHRSSVDLVGGVANPGVYPLTDDNLSILNLVSLGGGVSSTLRNPQIRLTRHGHIYGTSLNKLYANPRMDVTVKGGDKVIVSQDKRYFRSLGAAGKENVVYFKSDQPSALDAISLIGGVSDTRANPESILILREYPRSATLKPGGPQNPRMIFTIDLTTADGLFSADKFRINPEDTVLVTESPINSTKTVLSLIGNMFGVFKAAPK